jgi:hypothetical protein
MRSEAAIPGVARRCSFLASVFRTSGEPKSIRPAASQATRTTIPHNTAKPASRRRVITCSLLFPSRRLRDPMLRTGHYADFKPNVAERKENSTLSSSPRIIFSDMVPKCKSIAE